MREGRVSDTALQIARILVYLGGRPGLREILPSGMVDDLKALLVGAGLYGRRVALLHASPGFPLALRLVDALVGGGVLPHFPLRKRFVDDQVAEAVAAGAEQLLVLGAGLDPLGARWARARPTLRCVELDHPATGLAKARGLRVAGLAAPNLELVPVDLAVHTLASALQRTSWRPVRSVVVAEGLLMYLPEEAVQELFRALWRATDHGSRVIFSWIPTSGGRVHLDPLTRAVIAARGEPVRFCPTPEALGPLLERLGWRLRPPLDLRERYLAGGPLATTPLDDMERFSVAERLGKLD